MTDIKMSNTFDLPVSDGDFTLVAMNKSTYVSMDRAAVIAINSYDLNQERIAELELKSCTLDLTKGHLSQCEAALESRDELNETLRAKIAELERERDGYLNSMKLMCLGIDKLHHSTNSSERQSAFNAINTAYYDRPSSILEAHNLEQQAKGRLDGDT